MPFQREAPSAIGSTVIPRELYVHTTRIACARPQALVPIIRGGAGMTVERPSRPALCGVTVLGFRRIRRSGPVLERSTDHPQDRTVRHVDSMSMTISQYPRLRYIMGGS
jgi:hypothetical protein